MTLYAERKPSRHQPFAIIETRGSGIGYKRKAVAGYPDASAKETAAHRGVEPC